jgi:hypothetical protein
VYGDTQVVGPVKLQARESCQRTSQHARERLIIPLSAALSILRGARRRGGRRGARGDRGRGGRCRGDRLGGGNRATAASAAASRDAVAKRQSGYEGEGIEQY